MPNWSPNWENVRWDSQCAAEASGGLRRTADELERAAYERGQLGIAAVDGWLGPHRKRFDGDLEHGLKRLRTMAAECRAIAHEIDVHDRMAREEQRRREREREEWHREAERERRAREQQPKP